MLMMLTAGIIDTLAKPLKISQILDTFLAQSVQHSTLDLRVMTSSLTLGMEPTLKNK